MDRRNFVLAYFRQNVTNFAVFTYILGHIVKDLVEEPNAGTLL